MSRWSSKWLWEQSFQWSSTEKGLFTLFLFCLQAKQETRVAKFSLCIHKHTSLHNTDKFQIQTDVYLMIQYSSRPPSTDDFNSQLRSVLDGHGPVTCRKVTRPLRGTALLHSGCVLWGWRGTGWYTSGSYGTRWQYTSNLQLVQTLNHHACCSSIDRFDSSKIAPAKTCKNGEAESVSSSICLPHASGFAILFRLCKFFNIFYFMSCNIHYITPVIHYCHANILLDWKTT